MANDCKKKIIFDNDLNKGIDLRIDWDTRQIDSPRFF